MILTFEDCVNHVLRWEGGYSNDPNDPGGETNFGISKRAYPNLDIKHLTRDQAKQIYFTDYWQAVGADKMPDGLNLLAFDTAVNCGPKRARLWVMDKSLHKLFVERARHYALLDNLDDLYAKGWFNRLADIFAIAVLASKGVKA
jgi:lysozyme family protein